MREAARLRARDRAAGVVNVLTVDVEEYYHGMEFAQAFAGQAARHLPSRVVGETERLLGVLDEHGARGTFFVLGVVAHRFPRLVRSLVERGHDVASHGWDHTPVGALGAEAFRADVRRAKRALEQVTGQVVRGYRAPNYSIRRDTPWAFGILAEEGYAWDSSIYPVVHDRYGFPEAPRFPYRLDPAHGELWEVPIGTARLGATNLPVGGGYFRLFPAALLRAAIAAVNRQDGRPVVLYVHPWEFDPEQPRPRLPWIHRFRHYVGIEGAESKLRALLAAFRFTSVEAAFEELRPASLPVARPRVS